MSDTSCRHDAFIGRGPYCYKCGKELTYINALASVAIANVRYPLLKLTDVLKEAKIPMGKLAKALRKLQVAAPKVQP